MKSFKHIALVSALSLLLTGFCACSSDDAVERNSGNASGTVLFSLTDLGRAATRDGDPGEVQLEREKQVNSVIAVAFYANTGKFAVAAEADNITGQGLQKDWRVDFGKLDTYTVYFIANADNDLKNKLIGNAAQLNENSTATDFFGLCATQSPGDIETGTAGYGGFLMTSDAVNVAIDTDADGTLIPDVTVTRAVARIDVEVDAALVTELGFQGIEKITLENRYTQSKIARVGNDVDMGTLTHTDEVYNMNTPYANSVTATIYAYEDPNRTTVLVIEGKKSDNTKLTPTIRFDATHANIALQRNYLYKVRLTKNTNPADVGDIASEIIVKDWQTGDVISYTGTELKNTTAPTLVENGITVTTGNGTGTWTNAQTATVSITDAATATFTVKVKSAGSSLSKLVCKNQVDGFTVTEDSATRVLNNDGTTTQTFTVVIDANATSQQRTFTFKAENLMDADASGTPTITVTQAGS